MTWQEHLERATNALVDNHPWMKARNVIKRFEMGRTYGEEWYWPILRMEYEYQKREPRDDAP